MKTIKIVLAIVTAGGIGLAVGYAIFQNSFKTQQARWQKEKANLEAALAQAQGSSVAVATPSPPVQFVNVTNQVSAQEILDRLLVMKVSADDPRSVRLLVHQFESLTALGSLALPAIRAFLARNQDVEYNVGFGHGGRDGNVPLEFTVPPSLRLGLLETVKDIGGGMAEQILAETLKITGRGIEVAYLARALQEIDPNKYRDLALASARELLNSPMADPSDPLGKFDRNYLYGVFVFFGDNSATFLAQSQLVSTNGQVDRVALRYLQQIMNSNSVAMAAQLWNDPRISADQKEPLARVALTYAGASDQANQLFATAINDPNLSADARRNLIEDLNQDGLPNGKNLTATDLPLIQNRMALIQQLAPNAMDQVNARAFQEAYKDLNNMNNRLASH